MQCMLIHLRYGETNSSLGLTVDSPVWSLRLCFNGLVAFTTQEAFNQGNTRLHVDYSLTRDVKQEKRTEQSLYPPCPVHKSGSKFLINLEMPGDHIWPFVRGSSLQARRLRYEISPKDKNSWETFVCCICSRALHAVTHVINLYSDRVP